MKISSSVCYQARLLAIGILALLSTFLLGNAEPSNTPDLIIQSITITPPNPGAGDRADVTIVVKNQGTVPASNFNVYLWVNPASSPPTATTEETDDFTFGIPLLAGDTFEWSVTNHEFSGSDPHIYAIVDPAWENQVSESNEENNSATIGSPAISDGQDAYEDNDSCDNAKMVPTDGSAQRHNFYRGPDNDGPKDVDWVKFEGQAGVTYFAQAIADGADLDLRIALHGSCDRAFGAGSGDAIEFTAPATGIYYLKFQNRDDDYGPDNDYRVKITATDGCGGNYEPANEQCTSAGHIRVGGGGQTQSFCKPNDVDWTRFEVTAGVQYDLSVQNNGTNANAQVNLYASCTDASSVASGNEISYTPHESGFLYIKTNNSDPTVHGPDTDYAIQVSQNSSTTSCPADAFEPDNDRNQATIFSVNGDPQTHNICPAGDVDWIEFAAQSGSTYAIETLNLGTSADTNLCLFDQAGAQLECDNDGGAGEASRLVWTASENGPVYLRMTHHDINVAGPETQFDVRIGTAICAPDQHEPNDTQDSAKALSANGSTQVHNVCPVNDEDWVAFEATANTSYVIETTNRGGTAATVDTVLGLYDASGNRLIQNDDYAPGTSSRLTYRIATAGTYYVRVHLYNAQKFGTGSDYGLKITPGTADPVTPSPTATSTPAPAPTATPVPSAARTLILVNRAQIAAQYGEAKATALMQKLDTLSNHDLVRGDLINLDQNNEAQAVYAAWSADLTNVEKANQVASTIRAVVMQYVQERAGIEYLVLVGDDRALPFYRVSDNTPKGRFTFPEDEYFSVNNSHPTGSALTANYYLIDDFYADREPTAHGSRTIYLPDFAVGRLIETPDEMIAQIDAFLADPVTEEGGVLVAAYDFVEDFGEDICALWQTDSGGSGINCDLIGQSWSGADLRQQMLQTESPFKVLSINGHADHYRHQVPVGTDLNAEEVANAEVDLSGGLVYMASCHAGLNVPPTNSEGTVDMPQAFVQKRANFVGSTGYSYGGKSSIGWTEQLLINYTNALLRGEEASMGKALVEAKLRYFQADSQLSSYDEKVIQQLVFYGLPMYHLKTRGTLGSNDPFPNVSMDVNLPAASFSTEEFEKGSVTLDFTQALNESTSRRQGDGGEYFALNGFTQIESGRPIQPLHFGDVSVPDKSIRSVVIRDGAYRTVRDFAPAIGAPYNEYVLNDGPATLAASSGYYPPVPTDVRTNNGQSSIVTQLGQFNASTDELRLFETLSVDVYYSSSLDQSGPAVTVVDALYNFEQGVVDVKVDAVDESGIDSVVVSYVTDSRELASFIKSVELTFDESAHKWRGTFSGSEHSRYFVQIVDKAGNVTKAMNKGKHYAPAVSVTGQSLQPQACVMGCLFLPIVAR